MPMVYEYEMTRIPVKTKIVFKVLNDDNARHIENVYVHE